MKCPTCENNIFSKSKIQKGKYYCWVCHKYIIPLTESELKKIKKMETQIKELIEELEQ